MSKLMALHSDDVPEDITPEVTDVAPLRCEYDGCQNTLIYSGRGRKPKFCAEHKPSTVSSGGTKTRQTSWGKADAVEANLMKLLSWTAAGITFINPTDGKIIAEGAPSVAHELVELARIDKRYRAYLEWLAAPGKYGPLAMATAAIIVPVMANHGMLPQFIIPMMGADNGQEVKR